MEKSRIVEALGEAGLRLPALQNEALAANDRAKYLLTLLRQRRIVPKPRFSSLSAAASSHRRHSPSPLGYYADCIDAGLGTSSKRFIASRAKKMEESNA